MPIMLASIESLHKHLVCGKELKALGPRLLACEFMDLPGLGDCGLGLQPTGSAHVYGGFRV